MVRQSLGKELDPAHSPLIPIAKSLSTMAIISVAFELQQIGMNNILGRFQASSIIPDDDVQRSITWIPS